MLEYRDLNERTRDLMTEEIERDIAGDLYVSSYFTVRGVEIWPELLRDAAQHGDDRSLARAIREHGCLKRQVQRSTKRGVINVDVPRNAHETVAESNFSRFYIRAVCRRAIDEGDGYIVGYRAKRVMEARAGSEDKVGRHFDAADVLSDVRATMSTAPKLGMPPGPNSGILAHLP